MLYPLAISTSFSLEMEASEVITPFRHPVSLHTGAGMSASRPDTAPGAVPARFHTQAELV